MCLIHSIGGAFTKQPEDLDHKLSAKSSDLVKRAFDDIDPQKLIDHHVHVAGVGVGGTNTFVNRKMRTWRHPFHRLKFKVYMSSAGATDEDKADAQLVERLANLVRNIRTHGKHRLLAFDKHYRRDGSVNLEKTEFYAPNEYVFALAERYPELGVPNISVNPYRNDASEEL
jgi:mannonate dehydratase